MYVGRGIHSKTCQTSVGCALASQVVLSKEREHTCLLRNVLGRVSLAGITLCGLIQWPSGFLNLLMWVGLHKGSFFVYHHCRRLSPQAWREARDQVNSPTWGTCVASWPVGCSSQTAYPGRALPSPHRFHIKGRQWLLTPELLNSFPCDFSKASAAALRRKGGK